MVIHTWSVTISEDHFNTAGAKSPNRTPFAASFLRRKDQLPMAPIEVSPGTGAFDLARAQDLSA